MKNFKIYSRNVSNAEDITILLIDVRSRLIDRLKKIDEGSPKFDELVQQTKDRKKALDIYKENMRRGYAQLP